MGTGQRVFMANGNSACGVQVVECLLDALALAGLLGSRSDLFSPERLGAGRIRGRAWVGSRDHPAPSRGTVFRLRLAGGYELSEGLAHVNSGGLASLRHCFRRHRAGGVYVQNPALQRAGRASVLQFGPYWGPLFRHSILRHRVFLDT